MIEVIQVLYGIYDLTRGDDCVGVFNSHQAANFLNVTLPSFRCGVTRQTPFAGRYEVYKIKIDDEEEGDDDVFI
jgi:hypothetical protein